MNAPVVDLRSDTVTRPTPAMRRAIAEAVVGDDVWGDDPTVNELERRAASLTGHEAAVYVPSGTMGNQIAVNVHVRPGEEVLLDLDSHLFRYEQGAMSANSGALAHTIAADRGVFPLDALEGAIRGDDDHVARVRLLCLENTHNRGGGAIVPLERFDALCDWAHAKGLRVHLDGARLWNASVASGVPIARWASRVDSLMMCFSKGLGAPVGSVLTGGAAFVREARRTRKRFGGGMRQAGVLAAACLHALDHHVERLADDHARARSLGEALAGLPGVRVVPPDTNILIFHTEAPLPDAAGVVASARDRGVWLAEFGPRTVRAVTHLDVDDAGIRRAAEVLRDVLAPAAAGRRAG